MAKKTAQQPDDQQQEEQENGPGDHPAEGGGKQPPERKPLATNEDVAEVTIGGKKYTVPAAVAAAYESTSQVSSKLDRLEREVSNLRQPPKEPTKKPAAEEDDEFGDVDLDTLFLTDAKKAARIISDRAAAKARKDLTSAYQADQNMQAFWNDFYASNPDLAKHKRLVTGVMNEHWAELKDLRNDDAAAKMADLTRKEIMSIARTAGFTKAPQNNRTRSESGQSNSGGNPSDDGDGEEKVLSLSQILKNRAAARRSGEKKAS